MPEGAGCAGLCHHFHTLAAAAGAFAEVAGHHEVRPTLVKVTLLIAPILARRRVVAAELCMTWCHKSERSLRAWDNFKRHTWFRSAGDLGRWAATASSSPSGGGTASETGGVGVCASIRRGPCSTALPSCVLCVHGSAPPLIPAPTCAQEEQTAEERCETV